MSATLSAEKLIHIFKFIKNKSKLLFTISAVGQKNPVKLATAVFEMSGTNRKYKLNDILVYIPDWHIVKRLFITIRYRHSVCIYLIRSIDPSSSIFINAGSIIIAYMNFISNHLHEKAISINYIIVL